MHTIQLYQELSIYQPTFSFFALVLSNEEVLKEIAQKLQCALKMSGQ